MEWYWALALLVGSAISLMVIGMPVALAFFGANIVGAYYFLGGDIGLMQWTRNIVEAVGKFPLAPVACFVLMGEILYQSGVAGRAIDAVERLISGVPGRLSIVAVVGGTTFSALSGSTMANTALLGSTLMPEMRRRGYHNSIAMGPILGTGGIAMLIPPSGLAILLGTLSEISIAGILIAAIVPGIIMAVVHLSYVVIRCSINPSLAPAYDIPRLSFWERVKPFLIYVVPLLLLFVLVVGSILGGIATPTESASFGAVGAIIAAAAYRSLNWETFRRAVRETGRIAVMVLFIVSASLTFSQILSFSGATSGLLSVMQLVKLSPTELVIGMLLIALLLGCILDPLSIMLITLPFFVPLAEGAGINLIWFGVLLLLALEIGQTTPPFGLLLFVMKSVAPPDITMRHIYIAVAPFILLEVAILTFLVVFPQAVLWLPRLME